MLVSRQEFRDAMARLGAAVNIITTDGAAGQGGITATAVCSVTDDPPTLLVCLNRTSPRSAMFLKNGVLCVNTLSAGQQGISNAFSAPSDKADMASRFNAGTWVPLATGAPALEGAAANFDCRITEVLEQGTHSVVFAEVQAVRFADMAAGCLMYYARGYHGLPMGQG
ncbi:MAG: flavin reductase [Alphaproteobacteria bacterium]|nr:flavin reductase [Alphaproteobacteria bacterium]